MNERSNSFGYWLRRRRKALDLTQAALALKVCCSPAAIKKIEAEERRPSRALALRLAEHLHIAEQEKPAFLHAARTLGAGASLPVAGLPLDSGESGRPGSAAAVQPPPSPLAGRQVESERLLGWVAQLRDSQGRVVLIRGEPGIGKSRLMHEVACEARARHLPVLSTNCYEIERGIAYQAVIDLASQACDLLPEVQLRQITPILLAEIAALVPAVAVRRADLPALADDFPEARQARLFRALLQLFDALGQHQRLVLTIDNIQWADDASLRFIHFLARQSASRPILLACAYRDDELAGSDQLNQLVDSLGREDHVRTMSLARLGPGDVDALLRRLDHPKLDAPGLAARLHRETQGNPFFLWSMVQSLCEGESSIRDEGQMPLPGALRDSVRARLARVPASDRALLDLAAVFGRRFEVETLLALADAPEERVYESIDALVARRLLQEEADGGFYDFSHDKVREVVYGDIGTGRRQLLHRQVAQQLEAPDAGGLTHERTARLAEHYERARIWPKAVHYLALAAEESRKLFAMGEALQWFDRAIGLWQAHPAAATPAQQSALFVGRGVARAQAGQTDGAVSDFQRVIDAARAHGEHAHARDVLIQLGMTYRRADAYDHATACLDEALAVSREMQDERHVADTLYHLGTVAWSNGRNDLAIAHHREAVEICQRLALDDLVAVQAFHGRGEAHFANAEPLPAIEAFSRSLVLARGIGDRSYESENLLMIGWACTGHMGLADYGRALAHFDEALAITRAADLQWHLGPTLIGRAYVRIALDRWAEAAADLREALPRLETLGLVRYQMMAHDALGCLALEQSEHADALQHFECGLRLAHGAGIRYWVARLLAKQAIARLRCGLQVDGAGLEAALSEAQRHREGWLTVGCLEALAELALERGDALVAQQHAENLLAMARAGSLRELQARAGRQLGLAWLALASCDAADAVLREALALAQRIGHARLALECQAALTQVSAACGDARLASAR